ISKNEETDVIRSTLKTHDNILIESKRHRADVSRQPDRKISGIIVAHVETEADARAVHCRGFYGDCFFGVVCQSGRSARNHSTVDEANAP
ncbi:hypothetical protein ALC56_00858, partial [Trachymyrmex septentrionalis]